jgi:hypothetical protein
VDCGNRVVVVEENVPTECRQISDPQLIVPAKVRVITHDLPQNWLGSVRRECQGGPLGAVPSAPERGLSPRDKPAKSSFLDGAAHALPYRVGPPSALRSERRRGVELDDEDLRLIRSRNLLWRSAPCRSISSFRRSAGHGWRCSARQMVSNTVEPKAKLDYVHRNSKTWTAFRHTLPLPAHSDPE